MDKISSLYSFKSLTYYLHVLFYQTYILIIFKYLNHTNLATRIIKLKVYCIIYVCSFKKTTFTNNIEFN